MTYVGVPWRSRFLRAPKYAFQLAEQPAFSALEELASVRLGLKTGNDGFFFLRGTAPMAGTAELIQTPGRRVKVRGLLGWTGDLASADLKPAVLNPHTLFAAEGRRRFKASAGDAYYLCPRDRAPALDLPGYIALAEAQGVHEGDLVKSNAHGGHWYRQSRPLVTSRWLLPYNSAYDYGAWDNSRALVVNGRFVGVDPVEGVDADLLGAALNSTFVILTRLLVGVTTGVEGAFDVGPPAARHLAVPDVRRISKGGVARVMEAVGALRQADDMPAGPDDHAVVSALRRELDEAVLTGLGMTRGESAVVIDQSYHSYARWRRSIREMQRQMEVNRGTMRRSGVTRQTDPVRRLAQQIWEEVSPGTVLVPFGLLQPDEPVELVDLEPGWRPPADEPLIEAGTVRGTRGRTVDLGSWDRVRYVRALLTIGFRPPLAVPVSSARAARITNIWEHVESEFDRVVTARAVGYGRSQADSVIAHVKVLWRQASRVAGMHPPTAIDAPSRKQAAD